MLKKILLMALTIISAFGLNLSSSSKQDTKKYITLNGHKYQYVIGTASKSGTYYAAGYKLGKHLPKTL